MAGLPDRPRTLSNQERGSGVLSGNLRRLFVPNDVFLAGTTAKYMPATYAPEHSDFGLAFARSRICLISFFKICKISTTSAPQRRDPAGTSRWLRHSQKLLRLQTVRQHSPPVSSLFLDQHNRVSLFHLLTCSALVARRPARFVCKYARDPVPVSKPQEKLSIAVP
jgi:hypothetical protein